MLKLIVVALSTVLSAAVAAENVPIVGTVESKCVIVTEIPGVYGNPSPSVLSTAPADGGILPIVRYDVVIADYYKAVISTPDSFSSSPTLDDIVNWTGVVSVNEVTDPAMSAYDTEKVEYNNITEFNLSVAGSTWFKVESTADYGYNKAFPAGTYNAVVEAECIAR